MIEDIYIFMYIHQKLFDKRAQKLCHINLNFTNKILPG